MALTDADRQEIRDLVWDVMAACQIVEPLPASTDPMVKRMFQSRVLAFLKGQLHRTPEMGKLTQAEIDHHNSLYPSE